MRILDIGCGPGIYTKLLYDMGFRNIYGIDFSPFMIKKAIKLSGNRKINYKLADINKLPFHNNMFDIIICFGVFQYLNSAKDRKSALKEIKRVLKKNGILYFSTLNKLSLWNIFSFFKKSGIAPARYNPFAFCKDLQRRNFEILNLCGIFSFPFPKKILKIIYKIGIYDFLNSIFKITNFLSHSFFVMAKKL